MDAWAFAGLALLVVAMVISNVVFLRMTRSTTRELIASQHHALDSAVEVAGRLAADTVKGTVAAMYGGYPPEEDAEEAIGGQPENTTGSRAPNTPVLPQLRPWADPSVDIDAMPAWEREIDDPLDLDAPYDNIDGETYAYEVKASTNLDYQAKPRVAVIRPGENPLSELDIEID